MSDELGVENDITASKLGRCPEVIGTALIYISLALTIISMVDYVYKNVDVLKG
jgi:hypothetical protein